jgi:hypothetical protein
MYLRVRCGGGLGRQTVVSFRGRLAFDKEQFPRLMWLSSLEMWENVLASRRGPGRAETPFRLVASTMRASNMICIFVSRWDYFSYDRLAVIFWRLTRGKRIDKKVKMKFEGLEHKIQKHLRGSSSIVRPCALR